MFNKKRMVRECLNHVLLYDPLENTLEHLKTKGISVTPTKN